MGNLKSHHLKRYTNPNRNKLNKINWIKLNKIHELLLLKKKKQKQRLVSVKMQFNKLLNTLKNI